MKSLEISDLVGLEIFLSNYSEEEFQPEIEVIHLTLVLTLGEAIEVRTQLLICPSHWKM
jgi:hypothetical protein